MNEMLNLLLAASLTTVNTPSKYEQAVKDCAQGYVSYRYGHDLKALDKVLLKYPADDRPLVLIICGAYEEGFKDGRKGLN